MNTDNIYELAKQFKLESFKEHYRICQQVALIFDFKGKGDDADKFYIILEGSVRVLIEHDAEYKGFKEEVNTEKKLIFLENGEYFEKRRLFWRNRLTI